tara:strand:+ start:1021 stop:2196 length:1176 start_codon:yes stop_codon:yes gene_type:complete
MKKEFLNLGRQPLSNKFLKKEQFANEFFFDLVILFDEETKLVSMKNFVEPKQNFNNEYPYWTSKSIPMVKHFKNTANMLKKQYKPNKVLEIGSNDGTFIKNFSRDDSICVEPCGNFAKYTNEKLNYKTYSDYWNFNLSEKIKNKNGRMDLIYSANCISHINDLDNVFRGIKNILSDKGIFVFEDPSCLSVMERNSYDQIYDEHPHLFSVISLNNLLEKYGLTLFRVDNLEVHGGSNRIFVKHIDNRYQEVEFSVEDNLKKEKEFGLNDFVTYQRFADRVEKSKCDLLELLKEAKDSNKKVMCIGATCKSSVIFNYCGIDESLIQCISDTTPDKQNLFHPGTHIPIVDRGDININDYDYVFLGAWNFKDYIIKNENEFKGKFVTHVPEVHCV